VSLTCIRIRAAAPTSRYEKCDVKSVIREDTKSVIRECLEGDCHSSPPTARANTEACHGGGKQFRALAKAAGIQNVRIHDLRHAGATILMTLGVPDPIVRKVTGHRSRELER
jgi:integrase